MAFLIAMAVLAAAAFAWKMAQDRKLDEAVETRVNDARAFAERIEGWANAEDDLAADFYAAETILELGWYALAFIGHLGEHALKAFAHTLDLVKQAQENPQVAPEVARQLLGLSPEHSVALSILSSTDDVGLRRMLGSFRRNGGGPFWDGETRSLVFTRWPAPTADRDGRWSALRYNEERLRACCAVALDRARDAFAKLPAVDGFDWTFVELFEKGDGEKVSEPILRFRTSRGRLGALLLTDDPVEDAMAAFDISENRSAQSGHFRPLPHEQRWAGTPSPDDELSPPGRPRPPPTERPTAVAAAPVIARAGPTRQDALEKPASAAPQAGAPPGGDGPIELPPGARPSAARWIVAAVGLILAASALLLLTSSPRRDVPRETDPGTDPGTAAPSSAQPRDGVSMEATSAKPTPPVTGTVARLEGSDPMILKSFAIDGKVPGQDGNPGLAVDVMTVGSRGSELPHSARLLRFSIRGRVFGYFIDLDGDGKFESEQFDETCSGTFTARAHTDSGADLDFRVPGCFLSHKPPPT